MNKYKSQQNQAGTKEARSASEMLPVGSEAMWRTEQNSVGRATLARGEVQRCLESRG